jgi:beta-barrel assembly-enhancing protease
MFGWMACTIAFACAVGSSVACGGAGSRRASTSSVTLPPHGPCGVASLREARAFWESSSFGGMAYAHQRNFLERAIRCAVVLNDSRTALASVRAARHAGHAAADVWLIDVAVDLHLDALAVTSFLELVSGSPEQLATMSGTLVHGVLTAARRSDPSGRAGLRIHEALIARRYSPPDGSPDDGLLVDHARLLLEGGNIERARQLLALAKVADPRQILIMRISRVFDPLRSDIGFARHFDLRAATEANLVRARAASAAQPRKLWLVLEVVRALRIMGRTRQALSELERAIMLAQAPGARSRFDDLPRSAPFLLGHKAHALMALGRRSAGHATLRLHITAGQGRWPNPNLIYQVASLLEADGRPVEALRALDTLRPPHSHVSRSGAMSVAALRACAAAQLGNAPVLREAMAYLRQNQRDNVGALSDALLCANDLDGAAAVFVGRLGDRVEQDDALVELQIFANRPRNALPRWRVLDERLARVRDRPDVREAVEAVGRIEQVPLPWTY